MVFTWNIYISQALQHNVVYTRENTGNPMHQEWSVDLGAIAVYPTSLLTMKYR